MNILAIGNSFSSDATTYLHQIAEGAGEDIYVVNLFIGGCSLRQHWENIKNKDALYLKEVNGSSTEKYISVNEAIHLKKWDVITLQQASHESDHYENNQPFLNYIYNYLSKEVPDIELFVHQTWAYEDGSERLTEQMGYQSSEEMFAAVEEAYRRMAVDLGNCKTIPSGALFQKLRGLNCPSLHRDTFHASIPFGRFCLGAAWFECLTGKSIIATSFCPDEMNEEEWKKNKEMLHSVLCEIR